MVREKYVQLVGITHYLPVNTYFAMPLVPSKCIRAAVAPLVQTFFKGRGGEGRGGRCGM